MKKRFVCILLAALILILAISTTAVFAKSDAEVVMEVLKSQIVFDDFLKLKECVDANDVTKIYGCIIEIYPDFVSQIKLCSPYPSGSNAASFFTPYNPMILAGLGGIVIGVAGTLIAVNIKKKKKVQ